MDTPPETTLSTPSPTELFDKDPVAAENERSDMLSSKLWRMQPIYLVVATTTCTIKSSQGHRIQKLGIGFDGKLPWPNVKADMQYFKKVTESAMSDDVPANKQDAPTNTVVMGRKTYFSIPQKFRPLAGRRNIVITRSSPKEVAQRIMSDLEVSRQHAKEWIAEKYGTKLEDVKNELEVSHSTSTAQKQWVLSQAEFIQNPVSQDEIHIEAINGAMPGVTIARSPSNAVAHAEAVGDGQIFCIGGAEIYNAFLKSPDLRPRLRILQTEIESCRDGQSFECDTFWPENVQDSSSDWKEASKDEVINWTGIMVPQVEQDWLEDEKAGVKLRVRGWKHEPSSDRS